MTMGQHKSIILTKGGHKTKELRNRALILSCRYIKIGLDISDLHLYFVHKCMLSLIFSKALIYVGKLIAYF